MNASELRDLRKEDLPRENHSQHSIDPILQLDNGQDHLKSSCPLTRPGSSIGNMQASSSYLHDYPRANITSPYFESQQYGGTGAYIPSPHTALVPPMQSLESYSQIPVEVYEQSDGYGYGFVPPNDNYFSRGPLAPIYYATPTYPSPYWYGSSESSALSSEHSTEGYYPQDSSVAQSCFLPSTPAATVPIESHASVEWFSAHVPNSAAISNYDTSQQHCHREPTSAGWLGPASDLKVKDRAEAREPRAGPSSTANGSSSNLERSMHPPTGSGVATEVGVERLTVGSRAHTRVAVSNRKKDPKYFCRVPGCRSKGFTQKHNLEYHKRSHQNVRPYKCDNCLRAFGGKSDLTRHWKRMKGTCGPVG